MRLRSHGHVWTLSVISLLCMLIGGNESTLTCKEVMLSTGNTTPWLCTTTERLNFSEAMQFCTKINGKIVVRDNYPDINYFEIVMKGFFGNSSLLDLATWSGMNARSTTDKKCETTAIPNEIHRVSSDCSTLTQFMCECDSLMCKDTDTATSPPQTNNSTSRVSDLSTIPIQTTTSPPKTNAGTSHRLITAVGVGCGVGLPVLVVTVAGCIYFRRRRTRERSQKKCAQTNPGYMLNDFVGVEAIGHERNGQRSSMAGDHSDENTYTEIDHMTSYPDHVNIRPSSRGACFYQYEERGVVHTTGNGSHHAMQPGAYFEPPVANQEEVEQAQRQHDPTSKRNDVAEKDNVQYAVVNKPVFDDMLVVENDMYSSSR